MDPEKMYKLNVIYSPTTPRGESDRLIKQSSRGLQYSLFK